MDKFTFKIREFTRAVNNIASPPHPLRIYAGDISIIINEFFIRTPYARRAGARREEERGGERRINIYRHENDI